MTKQNNPQPIIVLFKTAFLTCLLPLLIHKQYLFHVCTMQQAYKTH